MALMQQQQGKMDVTPTRVKVLRGFRTKVNGQLRPVWPGSVVDVPFNVACNLKAAQKIVGVEPSVPLHLVENYVIPDRRRRHVVAGETKQVDALSAQVAELQRQVAMLSGKPQPKGG